MLYDGRVDCNQWYGHLFRLGGTGLPLQERGKHIGRSFALDTHTLLALLDEPAAVHNFGLGVSHNLAGNIVGNGIDLFLVERQLYFAGSILGMPGNF